MAVKGLPVLDAMVLVFAMRNTGAVIRYRVARFAVLLQTPGLLEHRRRRGRSRNTRAPGTFKLTRRRINAKGGISFCMIPICSTLVDLENYQLINTIQSNAEVRQTIQAEAFPIYDTGGVVRLRTLCEWIITDVSCIDCGASLHFLMKKVVEILSLRVPPSPLQLHTPRKVDEQECGT